MLNEGTHLNNGLTIVSDGPGVTIGHRCVIGPGVHVYDSDCHALEPSGRHSGEALTGAVRIEDDVFIGSGAIVLKGVRIGSGSVVGAGTAVSKETYQPTSRRRQPRA
jgi:maltose O-acetyltransferase